MAYLSTFGERVSSYWYCVVDIEIEIALSRRNESQCLGDIELRSSFSQIKFKKPNTRNDRAEIEED